MQVQRVVQSIGVWCVGVAIAGGLAVSGVSPVSAEDTTTTGNRVFFRGGYPGLNSSRGGELFTDGHNTAGRNDATGGYYVGAGTDLMLTRDLWGMMKGIGIVGEIGLEYKRFNSRTVANSDTTTVTGVSNGGLAKVPLTMLTIDVAPKVKFMQGGDFQPWIIPIGLDFHVISPPSNQTTVLDIGVQFGAGAEYRIWKELWLGVDARYHVASNQTSTVNNYGTVGAFIGIGF